MISLMFNTCEYRGGAKIFTLIILGAPVLRLKIWQNQPELLPKMAFNQLMIFTSGPTG